MANASYGHAVKIGILNVIYRICKLLVSSSCLGTFYDPYSSFLINNFTLSSVHSLFSSSLLNTLADFFSVPILFSCNEWNTVSHVPWNFLNSKFFRSKKLEGSV